MTTHAEARALAQRALKAAFGNEPSLTSGAVKCLAGVACIETSYGDGWKGAGKGSHNMGAIQCGTGWTGPRFEYVDTHPNADGTSTPYRIGFRKYLTADDGWRDLVKTVYVNRGRASVLNAAQAGDIYGVSECLHQTGYYEGFGKTVADRVSNHHRALSRAIAAADGSLYPVAPVVAVLPTLRRGAQGEEVKLLQRELRLAADGAFGRITDAELRAYQLTHGLTVDGVAGPATWAHLLSDDYIPGAA
jgi:peptidoglycan hydrolase-like protein with peptidoglycan-binding domain